MNDFAHVIRTRQTKRPGYEMLGHQVLVVTIEEILTIAIVGSTIAIVVILHRHVCLDFG